MINIGKYIETAINWLTENFAPLFDAINVGIGGFIDGFQNILMWIPFYVTIALLAILAWYKSGKGVSIFTILGLLLIWGMGFWNETMQTLALVLSSTIIALIMGLPLGIWSANSKRCDKILHPILDLMQTMPAFVYLIPAVLFFGLGTVPGAFATIIFAMPPVVRLTSPGIKQVPKNVVEASRSFGATPMQLLFKVQLPLALPTIMTGINQTILMSLSMVVIAAMIAAGGLGEIVLKGITQMKIGLGFEGGIAVVIPAIILDRITQGLGKQKEREISMKKILYFLSFLLLLASCSGKKDDKTISIGYINWDDGIALTYLTEVILEQQGYHVVLKNADPAPIYATMARGKVDLLMDAWLPATQADYMKQYGKNLEILGKIYPDARIGLVVPDYVDIHSIEQLNANKEKFGGEIIGIDAGAGIMHATDMAIEKYNLDYKLLESSGPAMTAVLKRAVDEHQWIVVTGWTPHWMFTRFKLKFLEDPKGIFGKAETITAIARKGFGEQHPFVAKLIENIHLSTEEISSLLDDVSQNEYNEKEGAEKWVKEHQELVDSWIPRK